jgi:membrane-bound ClpP family serine protease
MVLNAVLTGHTNEIDPEKVKVGDIGITIGRLAPMGKIKVNDEVVEVRSTGTFVNPGEQVRIIHIEKSLITVEPLNIS